MRQTCTIDLSTDDGETLVMGLTFDPPLTPETPANCVTAMAVQIIEGLSGAAAALDKALAETPIDEVNL